MSPMFPDVFAAVLVGGRAQRLGGADKARLRLPGDRPADAPTLVGRLVRVLRPLVAEVVLSGRGDQRFPELDCRLVADIRDRAGPLAGLEAVLGRAPAPWCFLVAGDMPLVDAAMLLCLVANRRPGARAVLPRTAAGVEPTCALYHASLRVEASAALEGGRRALHATAMAVEHVEVELPPALVRQLANINTEADLAALGTPDSTPRRLP